MIRSIIVSILILWGGSCYANTTQVWEGTGEFINQKGDILTANHVLTHGDILAVRYGGKIYKAEIIAVDELDDLAIIHINVQNKFAFKISKESPDKDSIGIILGFPVTTEKLTITIGKVIVSNDYISITNNEKLVVCGGNSGGPVIDELGFLVGVVQKSLNDHRDDLCGHTAYAATTAKIINFLIQNKALLIPSLETSIDSKEIVSNIIRGEGVVQTLNFTSSK